MLPTITCWELVNRIHSLLGERHKDAMYEGIITGADDDIVSGILVANEPSVKAISLAAATGKNCILCREHPFYLFGEYLAVGLADPLVGDPVSMAKRQLIEDHHLLIIRLAALWDAARPEVVFKCVGQGALLAAGSWRPRRSADHGLLQHTQDYAFGACKLRFRTFEIKDATNAGRSESVDHARCGDPWLRVSYALLKPYTARPGGRLHRHRRGTRSRPLHHIHSGRHHSWSQDQPRATRLRNVRLPRRCRVDKVAEERLAGYAN